MATYGDDCKIEPGIIQGDMYTFLTESKTALFVQEPAERTTRLFKLFFLVVPLAIAAGAFLDGTHYVLVLPCVAVAFFAAVSLVKGLRRTDEQNSWKLFIGNGESPFLIYSNSDATEFAAKRTEIEQALLGRSMREEK